MTVPAGGTFHIGALGPRVDSIVRFLPGFDGLIRSVRAPWMVDRQFSTIEMRIMKSEMEILFIAICKGVSGNF
jgi:hypothetical protein